MARHRDCLSRWPLQRCCACHIECHLNGVSFGFLLCGLLPCSVLSFGPLECDGETHISSGLHCVCSRTVRFVRRTSERSGRLCELSARQLEWNGGTVQCHPVHQLCSGQRRSCSRSIKRGGGMSNLSNRFLLPRWKCTGWMQCGSLLPSGNQQHGSALSDGILLCVDEYDCRLSIGTLWEYHTAHGGDWLHGMCGRQIRISGQCDDGSRRLYQLPIGHVGQCTCIGGPQLVHQLRVRHRRTHRRSVDRRCWLQALSLRLLLPRRQCTGGLHHRCLLSLWYEHE
jgi:hypothetical protein